MKNRLVLLLLIIVSVSLLFSLNADSQETQETVIRVAPHALESNTQTVDIVIENGQNVAGYQVLLQFNSASLTYIESQFQHGDYLPEDAFFGTPKIIDIDTTDSFKTIRFAAVSYTGESNGNGILATLKFNKSRSSSLTLHESPDLTLLGGNDGTVLSNKVGDISLPRLEHSQSSPAAIRDLVVESIQAIPIDDQGISTDDARHLYNIDEKFEFHVSIRNIGNVSTSVKKLELYRSTGLDTDAWEKLDDIDIVPKSKIVVKPNRLETAYISDVVPLEDIGTYYYRVCVKVTSETDDENNCSTIKIEVGTPDLSVDEVWAELANAPGKKVKTVAPGGKFKLSATVRNTGSKSDSTIAWFFYRNDVLADSTTPATQVRAVRIPSLPLRDGTNEYTVDLIATAPETMGTYTYRVSVDQVNGEKSLSNNFASVEITVEAPDLVLEEIKVSLTGDKKDGTTDITLSPKDEFYLHVRFKNEGIATSDKTQVLYYRSDDDTISETGTLIRTGEEVSLIGMLIKIGEEVSLSGNDLEGRKLRRTAPTTPGTYYYGAYVKSIEGEIKTDNNWSGIVKINVTPENVYYPLGLTPEDQFTDIAVTENATYFVWKPDVPKVLPGNNIIPYQSIITLDISPYDDDGALDKIKLDKLAKQGNLPSEYPYFIVPLREGIPMEEWEAAGDIFTWWKVLKSIPVALVDEAKSLAESFVIDKLMGLLTLKAKIVISGSKVIYAVFMDARDLVAQEDSAKDLILEALHDPSIVIEDIEVFGIPRHDSLQRYLVMIPRALEEVKIRMDTYYFSPALDVNGNVLYTTVSILKNQGLPGTKGNLDLFWESDHIRFHLPDGKPQGKNFKTLFEYWIDTDNENWFIWPNEFNSKKASVLDDVQKSFIKDKLQLYLKLWDQLITRIDEIELNKEYFVWNDENEWKHPLLELKLPTPGRIPGSVPTDPLEWDYLIQLRSADAAAPNVQPISLADYPPFQQLPPEVQEYLLQHFEGTANLQTLNSEMWQIPEKTSLLPNYPNPFNPETWIPYQLAKPANVTLTIYDINGRVVRDLDLGHQRAGIYQSRARAAHWDGKNATGEPVASGLYFYTLKAGEFSATRKMLIRK